MPNQPEKRYHQRVLLNKGKIFLDKASHILMFLLSVATITLLIYEFGYSWSLEARESFFDIYDSILIGFFILSTIRIMIHYPEFRKEKGFWFEIIIYTLLFLTIISDILFPYSKNPTYAETELYINYAILIVVSIIELAKDFVSTFQRYIKPEMMFIYSFLIFIFAGALLLMLPRCHYGDLDFWDAFFTSTSAVCVTGLSTVNISSTFTFTGQIVIISLIQIGGIGVMTFTSFIAMSFFNHINISDQMALKDIISENSLNKIFQTLLYIVITTFTVEILGGLAIYHQIRHISPELIPDKIFFSVFHTISSFCNAGFSTLPESLYDPVVRNMYGLQKTIALLIIIGGIGFPIVFNFGKLLRYYMRNILNKIRGNPISFERKYHILTLTTKLALLATVVLLCLGTLLFFLFEKDNTLAGMSTYGKVVSSFFGSATTRSGGLNNVDMEQLLPASVYLTIMLMWIGASPMSTGGGIKTTTFVIAFLNMINTIKGKPRVEISHRQVTASTVNKANTIILLSVLWTSVGTILLTIFEPGLTVTQAMFEVFSAFSTTGLSLNVTPTLGENSKILLCVTMFAGRIGLFNILKGMIPQKDEQVYTYPDEDVIL